MVATGWTAWCAVTNSNPWTGPYWSPVQTRPRLLTRSRVLPGAGGPPGGAGAVRPVPPSSARRCVHRRRGPLASPSCGSPARRARTGGPILPASAPSPPTRRSAAGTPARTADGSSASWTLLSAPTMGCPRNRVNSTPATLAATQATTTIPIVFGQAAFPETTGLVTSLARRAGNLTEAACIAPEYGKRLELLREVSPKTSRVAVIYNDQNIASILAMTETQQWAQTLQVAIDPLGVHDRASLDTAFDAIRRRMPDAL